MHGMFDKINKNLGFQKTWSLTKSNFMKPISRRHFLFHPGLLVQYIIGFEYLLVSETREVEISKLK